MTLLGAGLSLENVVLKSTTDPRDSMDVGRVKIICERLSCFPLQDAAEKEENPDIETNRVDYLSVTLNKCATGKKKLKYGS